jgi:hypothetical protein
MKNKNIQKLIVSATEQVDVGPEGLGGSYYEDEINAEKLVKLVVEQCVTICQETGDITRKGCRVTEADVCGYKIRQYFGIT